MESPSKSTTPSQQGTPRNLESMSQEDLVKNCKKQRILMQKLKAKCDDLQGKLKNFSDYDEIKETHTKLLEKNDELQKEMENITFEKHAAEKAKGSLSEELECLQMKQETLVSSLQCLQEDFTKATSENKHLHADAELTQKRVTALKHKFKEMQIERQDLNDQVTDKDQQLSALKGHIKKLTESENQMSESNKALESENKAIKSELSAVKISLQFFEQEKKATSANSQVVSSQLKLDIERLQAELSSAKSENDDMKQMVEALQGSKASAEDNTQKVEELLKAAQIELELKREEFNKTIAEFEKCKEGHLNKISEMSEKLTTACHENEETSTQLSKLVTEKETLESTIKGLHQSVETFKTETEALTKQNKALESNIEQKATNENKDLQDSKTYIDELNAKIQSLVDTNLTLKETCESKEEEKQDLETKTNQLQEALTQVEQQLTETEKTIENLKETVEKEKELNNEASRQEVELCDKLQASNDIIESLRGEVESLKEVQSSNTKEFDERIAILHSKNEKLVMDLKENEALISSMQNEKQKLETLISEQNEKKEQLLAEMEKLERDQSSDKEVTEKYLVVVKQDKEKAKVIAELQQSAEESKSQLQNAEELLEKQSSESDLKISELLGQNEDLNSQLSESISTSKQFEEEISHLRAKLHSVEQANHEETENLTNKTIDLTQQITSLQTKLDDVTQGNAHNTSEHQTMLLEIQGKLSNAEQSYGQLQTIKGELEASLTEKEKELVAYRVTNEGHLIECKALQQSLEDIKSQLCESKAEVEHLTTEQQELLKKVASLEDEKQTTLLDLENVHAEKNTLVMEIDKIKLEMGDLKFQESSHQQAENDNSQVLVNLKSELCETQENAQKLQAALTDLKTQLETEILGNKKLSEEHDKVTNERNAEITRLQTTQKSLEAEHANQIAVLQNERNALEEKLSSLETLKESLVETENNHLILKKENQELIESVACLKEENGVLDGKYERELAKVKELTKTHREAIIQLEEALKHAQMENDHLKLQIQTVTEECEASKTKITALENVEQESLQQSSNNQSEKIEALEKSIKEKDIYNAKLKALTVKARKELDSTKQQLQKVQEERSKLQTQLTSLDSQLQGSQAHASNVQMMQIECDKLQDQVDLKTEEKQAMQKNIEELFVQLAAEKDEKQAVQVKLDTARTDHEKLKKDKQDVEVLLTNSKSTISSMEREKDNLVKENNNVKQELDAVRIQLTSLSKTVDDKDKKLQESEEALKDAKKNLKQHDLMSLEMAEYDKTINDLQTQTNELESVVEEKSEEIERLEGKISALQDENKTIENLRVDAEDRVTKNKESLDKCREEISTLASNEAELKGQVEVITGQLEVQQQQNEQFKLELSGKTAEQRELQEKIESLRSSSTRTIDLLERKVNSLQVELSSQRLEFETLSSDYESYKVRVHSVLKQQKCKDSQPAVQPDKTEILQLRQKLSQIQAKLVESQNVLTSREGELDLLQGDYDRLLRQQQQSSESAVEREGRWKTRVKSLQQELTTLRKQHTDLTQKMTQQNELASESVERELGVIREERNRETDILKGEIEAKDNELCALRNEIRSLQEEKHVSSTPRKPSAQHFRLPSVDHSHHFAAALDYRSVAREDGEGEENPDVNSIVSFEQVLQAPNIKSVTELSETASMTSEMHLKQLETKFEAQTKQLEHLSEVARENEAMSARLSDQNKVLKDEIRRLEKNQEREQSVANLEYLKNVVYKFVTLPPSDERRHLLPVIDTMLKLSPEERNTLQAIATDDDATGDGQTSSGWGSYLQRWSGMQ